MSTPPRRDSTPGEGIAATAVFVVVASVVAVVFALTVSPYIQ